MSNLLLENDVITKLQCDQSNGNFHINLKNLIDFALSYLGKSQTSTLSGGSWKLMFRFINVASLCFSMETILRRPSTLLHQRHIRLPAR